MKIEMTGKRCTIVLRWRSKTLIETSNKMKIQAAISRGWKNTLEKTENKHNGKGILKLVNKSQTPMLKRRTRGMAALAPGNPRGCKSPF